MPAHFKAMRETTGDEVMEVWSNDLYEVFVYYLEDGRDGALWLSLKSWDREPVTDWRHKQSLKNEIAGGDREALELFPAEDRLVDGANQTHIWVLPVNMAVPFGMGSRAVTTAEESVRALTAIGMPQDVIAKGRQRPWQPGLSTGPDFRP